MRGALIIISFSLIALIGNAQEKYSDASQYAAYQEGEWELVLKYSKMAKAEGVDFYYLRVRTGYANFMLKRYRQSAIEFDKALEFNSADRFSKRYGYWAKIYSGQTGQAKLMASGFTKTDKDTIKVIAPNWISSIGFLGGYRISSSPTAVSNMPYGQLNLSHELGKRFTLDHGASFLKYNRRGSALWQAGYLAQLGVLVEKRTTLRPFFLMQYWESGTYKVYDLGAGAAIKHTFSTIDISVHGGYIQRTDDDLYQAGATLSWFPLSNPGLYSHTTANYIGADTTTVYSLRQTIGGNVYKGLWLNSTFVWSNELLPFEAGRVDFSNTSIDALNWKTSVTLSYVIRLNFSISATYTAESRKDVLSGSNYNYHSTYIGLFKKF